MNQVIWKDMEEIERRGGDWNWLQDKTMLVSGSYGMLASYVVFFLIYLNEAHPDMRVGIVAQGRNEKRMRERFGEYMDRPYFHPFFEDICSPLEYDGPIDYIVHAASLASPQNYSVNPVGTLLPNSVGTYQLLELARRKNVQGFLFFSSGDVYGAVPPSVPQVTEETLGLVDPMALRSCYGESKRIGETMCKAWHHQYGVPAVSIRICHTYGPTCDLSRDERVFAEFTRNLIHGEDIVMKSDGLATRMFCYLSDAAAAFFRVLRDGKRGEAYNMGNSQCMITIRELAERLARAFPEKNIHVRIEKRSESSTYMESPVKNPQIINTDKLMALGWTPTVGIEEGFRRMVEYYDVAYDVAGGVPM